MTVCERPVIGQQQNEREGENQSEMKQGKDIFGSALVSVTKICFYLYKYIRPD